MMFLVAIATGSWAEVEPYAALSNGNKTLTFYYDGQKASRNGMVVGPFDNYTYESRGWNNQRQTITTVVFDASFANYRPTSTAVWFAGFLNLTTITNIENLKTDKVTDMYEMFFSCSSLTSLDLSGFNTEKVTNMYLMFCGCNNLTSLNVSSFNTSNLTNLNSMFLRCYSLTSLDLGSFNTVNVIDMAAMFGQCSSLTSLDLSSFNTGNVMNIQSMFSGCKALTRITVDPEKWNISNVIYGYDMFEFCNNLVGGNGTAYESNHRDATYAVIDKPGTPGYLTDVNAHTHTAGDAVQENMVGPSCTTDGQYDVVEYCTICGEEMSRDTQYIPALGHDLTYVPEVPATTTADGMKEHYTCSRCTDLINMSYAIVTASDLVIPKLVEPEAYAALSDNDQTLTFYYDGQKASRNGMSVGPFTYYSDRGWHNQRGTITTVVFDASFANYKPTSTAYWLNNLTNLTTITGIENLKTDEVTEMHSMFAYCSSLTSLDLSSFNTANVTNMGAMFDDCSSLTSLDLSSFNTANVTIMGEMFDDCSSLTSLDVSGFNTAKVTYMDTMFMNCSSLTSLDLSSFNTENVTNMAAMFRGCSGLTSLDLSSFNTAKVEDMYEMFWGCSSLTSLDLTGFNTANVTNMNSMFAGCSSLTSLDVSGFNTDNVTEAGSMFSSCSGLTGLDLSSFNTANVEYTGYMFWGCTALMRITVDPEKWNMSNIYGYGEGMFYGCTSLVGGNGTVYDENHTNATYAVIDKPGTPGYLTDVNAPVVLEAYAALSNDNKTLTFYYDYDKIIRKGMSVGPFTDKFQRGWDNQSQTITTVVFDASFANYKPTSTAVWFYICENLTTITGIENLKTDEVTDMSSMFSYCYSLTSLDLSGFNTSNVTNMKGMFDRCSNLTSLDVSSFNTAKVENMYGMFASCSSLTSLDVSSFNTAKVENMYGMFSGCSSLTNLDLSSFNTEKVTNMSTVFMYCSNLTSIDLSSFNTDNVTEMATMFGGCSSLASLDVSSFNTENVESMAYMFANCSGLTSLDLSSFNTANVKYMTRMFGGCTALTKITVDPGKWDTSKITNSDNMFDNCTSLVGGNGTVYQFNHTDATYAVIDKPGTPGYLTDVNTPVEPEAYAVLSDDNKTLTFYYDMEKASRGGMSVGPFDGSTTLPAWSDKAGSIRNANIDESFAGYSELTSTAYWFEGCSELKAVSGLENLVMDNVTDMSNMFKGCNNLRSVSLSGMNTGKVANMHGLFWDCNALQSIDLSTLDTRSVTDMSGMFNYCSGLKTVDLSGVNTASVTDMNNMFYYCSSLTDLDLSSFNTGSVTNMRYMFEGCSSLTKITVSETGWTTNAVTSATAMFRGCRDIVGGNGTTYDAGHTDEGYARIDKAGTPGYLTSSAGTGIFNVEGKAMGDGYFYTPDGRRIEGQPTKQGFYISNGRKVMVK